MTKISDIYPSASKRMKAEDISNLPKVLTISEIDLDIESKKIILSFKETIKTLKCSKTNAKVICDIAETDEVEDWTDTEISIYIHKDTGGLRVRKPTNEK